MVIFAPCIRNFIDEKLLNILCYKAKYESIIRENEQIRRCPQNKGSWNLSLF